MGTSGNVFVKSAVILIFLGALTVSGYENDDIVFDQDGRNSAIEVPLIERQQDQSFFQRVKRGLFDWFGTPTTTPPPTTTTSDGENDTTETSFDSTETLDVMLSSPVNEPKKRISRESGEENSVDQTSPKVEDNDIGNTAAGYPLPIYPTTDDEDLEGSGDVEGSAGDEDLWGNVGTDLPVRPSGQPQYYRVTLKVIEPYKREYSDRHSKEYQELAGNVTKVIEDLYRQKIPNFEHSANVVMISPLPDPFSTQVTIDVGSMFDDGFNDELEIRQILEKQLQLHSLGSLQVGPDGFTFRKVQAAGGPECDENSEMRCRDGTCIPLSQRCDGIPQCHDDSDELDCPKETSTERGQGTTKNDEDDDKYKPSSSHGRGIYEQPRTYHSFVNLTTPLDSDNRVKCRGDDFALPCKDGSRYICSVQKCDGIPDCDDQSDEEGCYSSGCGDGEFACDVTRCILESKRCDFNEDCKDGSDEHSCSYPACSPSEFKCRNSQCVPGSLRCNGVPDCRDGSDEKNCPCKEDEFECTPRFCIPLDRRCDGINDCSNERDEKDCDSNPRCRDGEFTCDDGSCVSLRARCDGHSDCSDRSDERNCTVITCNSNQFRCQDGTCLDIERRCDNYPDCNNGEDELQCGGAGCGPSEFSCNDGHCVPYRLQCNGVNDCRDGSDERDCVEDKTGRQYEHDEAGRHNLQNGLSTSVRTKNRNRKHNDRLQGLRVAPRRNEKMENFGRGQKRKRKHKDSIRKNVTSNRFEIPSAGDIGDPIFAAFPELEFEFEKRNQISDSSEENSPNKEWEIIDIDHEKNPKTNALRNSLYHSDLEEVFKGSRKIDELLDYDKLDVEDFEYGADDTKDANVNLNVHYETTTFETRAPTQNGHEDYEIRRLNHPFLDRMTQTTMAVTSKSDKSDTLSKEWESYGKFMGFGTTMHPVIVNSSQSEVIPPIKAEIRIVGGPKRNEMDIEKIFADAKKIEDPVIFAYPEIGLDTENYYEGQYDEDVETVKISSDNSEEYVEPYEDEEDYEESRFNQNSSIDIIETSSNASSEPKNKSAVIVTEQKWNLTTRMPIFIETVGTTQANSPDEPRKKRVFDLYKEKYSVTKKLSEANTDEPHTYNPKNDAETISNHTFKNSSKNEEKLYRYTKDTKEPDPSDVVNKILAAKRLAASLTSTAQPSLSTTVKSYRNYLKMLHEEKKLTTSDEKKIASSTSATPITKTKMKSHRDYKNKLHEENASATPDDKTTPSATYSIFTTEVNVEMETDSKDKSGKSTDFPMKKNKGANQRSNKANRANSEKKERKKGPRARKNLKVTKKPEPYKHLKVESELYVKKGMKVNLPIQLEFDEVPEEMTKGTTIKTTIGEPVSDDDGPEECAKCASFWKKKFVESIADTSTKTSQPKKISLENDNKQNVDSGLDVSSENCTDFDSKTNPTSDGPQDSESREIVSVTRKCTKISATTAPGNAKEDFEIIPTERSRRKKNGHGKNNRKKKNGKRNKKNGKKKTTLGIIPTTTSVDETTPTIKKDTTEGFNQNTEGDDNSTKMTFEWTEFTKDYQTTIIDDTTTIAYQSDYGSSEREVNIVTDTPTDATISVPIVKTTSVYCGWFDLCDSDESNEKTNAPKSETTEQPNFFSSSTMKPCISDDCSDSKIDETSDVNTESPSTIPYIHSSEYLVAMSSTAKPKISTGATEEKDLDSMESSVSKEKRSRIPDKSELPEVIRDSKEDDTVFWSTTILPDIYRSNIDMEGEISEEILHVNEKLNTQKWKPIGASGSIDDGNSESKVKESSTRPNRIKFTLTSLKPLRHQCQIYEYNCDGFRCIDMRNICNGVFDCNDRSDETFCPLRLWRMKNRFDAERCRDDQLACDKSLCLEQGTICDGIRHCDDGSDEMDCDHWNAIKKAAEKNYRARYRERLISTVKKQPTTTSYPRSVGNQKNHCDPDLQFECRDGRCIDDYMQCDGYNDCIYGEDEDHCLGFAPCPSMDFTCEDGSCIPKTKVCDGIDNCPRAEDELHCDRECTPTQFKCGSGGKCIEGIYRCDGHPDCPDQSDEDKCPGVFHENVTHTVTHSNAPPSRPWITERPATGKECDPRTEMRCADGRQCILLRRKCDSVFDCFDNSDEADCGGCEQDEWKCASGECVTENARCDGKEHCPDGSDEIGCADCPAGTFRCNDGLCLDVKRLCDGRPHCRDGSDEFNCQTPYCPDGQAPCDNGVCIDQKFLCDKNNDCLDGSDEARCPDTMPEPQACSRYQFTCRDGSCIPREAFCDGHHDCPDGDDEDCQRGIEASDKTSSGRHPENVQVFTDSTVALGVTGTETGPWSNQSAPRICTEGDFVCADGTCIPAAHRCDNFYDCRDFTDEQYCFECSSDQFQCRSGDCISNRQKCDGLINCDDGSDEEDCEPETTPRSRYCSADQFTCVRDRNCVHYSSRCNGIPDCRDNSDEEGCDTEQRSGLDLKTRPSEQVIKENPAKQGREVVFQCRDEGSQRAKVRWLRGNGRPLPPGSRDINGRLEIPNIQMEHSGTYICEAVGYPPSTPGRQVTVHLEVEKLDLPVTRPPQVCKYDEATCSNGDCIPKSSVCNGKYDCTDGSDEMRCNPHGCEPNQFRCANKECVSKVWRCDGDKDCRDGTDEENCEPPPPGSPCRYDEYQCAKYDQCIPKSYHCDMERDCQDGSDEFGCSSVYITKPPPGMMTLHVGETMILTCSAVGVPVPEINWRLNWGHVPPKCYSTSHNGTGTLTCPDIQVADQGAYSCEALNPQGFVFAVPDTILVVDGEKGPCRPGTFNDEARSPEECISCFCFGVSNTCKSANLFTYQLRPPFNRFRVVNVEPSPSLRVLNEISSLVAEVRPRGSNGADIYAPYSSELTDYNVPYFAIPENFYGPSSLKSYGGYLKYTVSYSGDGRPNNSPDVVLSGNGFTLIHRGEPLQPNIQNDRQVRFFYGEWYKNDRGQDIRATREEIMMVLAKVDHILIKAKYEDSPELQVSITDIVMDTAADTNVGLGAASYVEECTCPTGYHGYSCESCAPGYIRRTSGAWLGECYLPPQPNDTCKEGFYGDPLRNIPCERCACPLTNPANQFARTCHLGAGRSPVCDCLPEYSGPQCQYCADGYVGNPRIPGGGKCERKVQCNPDGSLTPDPDAEGKCRCKQYATGLLCDECKVNTFNLATKNQFGCISCFCMGITDRCTSSYWFRNEIRVPFTNSIRNFTLVESNIPNAKQISEGIRLDTAAREIVYSDFPNRGNTDVYYWQLPNIFLGNQITSYGGDLRYTVRYVPSPGGQSSRNNAADVELISANDIVLHYYSRETPEANTPQSFTVPLLEQYWQRVDGTQADREHLLMALADVEDIRIKATYTTHTDEAALSQVSLDIAEKTNTGKERAYEVEECSCPVGYRGLSCEDCAVGYTKADNGFYLGICEPCSCNGHSSQCDPETGVCENCGNHTTGENCELCEPGYQGDATRGGCTWNGGGQPTTCDCDPAGSESDQCVDGRCYCKGNVEGARCNRCRPSTFGLSADNIDGCNECYCSGVTNQCQESSLYIQPLPMWVYDDHHGFTLTDASRLDVIDDGFIINDELNEIGYRFSNNRNRRLFWSLPATFTGNKVKSYGGKLTVTQHITALPNSQILKDQDVLLIGNGITLFWTNPLEILPGLPMTYSVPLRESEWRRLSTAGPRRASRTDLMTVLSNLDAILVRASHSEGMTATYISDISLDSATENRKTHRATQIEACRCPQGYSGTSCETCAPGYYRDLANRTVSILGSCNACPCNNHEESCSISGSGQIRCNCRSGYGGRYCQDIAELRVGLMPIKPQATKGNVVNFTCSYDHWDTLYIYLKLTQYYGLPLTSWEIIPGPLVTTGFGAHRMWSVHVGDNPCNVECLIVDGKGKELAKIATTISPVDDPEPLPTLPPPTSYPKIEVTIQEKKFQIVQTGSTVRLHCSGRSVDNAPLQIQWEKEGQNSLPDRSSDDYNGLLIIRDIRVSDSGIYVCRVTDGINIVFEKVSISVGGARPEAPRAMIRPNYLQVKEGEPVRFHCEATGNPEPEIEWIRVQGEMSPESRSYRGVLQIPAAIRSDAGQYKCIARNDVGINEQTTVLYVSERTDRPHPEIIPSKPPTITPTQWTGSAGDAVRLICARSNYHASVAWIRSGNLALPQSFSQRDGVLTIGNPIPTDSGIYICTAVSFQGTETSTSANVTIFPKRTHPSVRVEPERQTVSQGTEAEIRCIVDRDSGLQIKWVKYGESSLGPNARQLGDTLKIMSPQVSDRGVYICRASSSSGSHEASAIVEVTPRETPILELHPKESQIVNLGGSADIQCRVTAGIPMPEVHWNREDGRQFSSNIQQLPGGLLRLTNVSVHDGGSYRCSASNTVGSTSAIARIEVQSLPIITVTPPGGLIYAKRGARVMLTCTAQGLPQPTVAWMKSRPGVAIYTFARRPEASRLSAVHEIMSMSPDDEGSYTCQAINAAGVTEERVQIRIEEDNNVGDGDPREPDYTGGVRIPNDSLSVPSGGTVTIRCQVYGPTNGPRIDIDWRRSDRRALPIGSFVRDHALTIENATREAAGEYVCLGVDPSGREVFRARAHVDVVSLPNIKLDPSRQTVRPGESPAIVCTATGDQPMTIEWDAIGRDLPYSVTNDRGVLQFNRITYTDAGKYVCKARNNAGIAEAVAEVLVSENTVDDPVIRAVDRDITTYPGSTVTLRCDVRPRSVIEWTKNGRPLSRNVRVGEDYIELTNVQREDGGTYTCQVRTSHGQSNDYINLRVEEAQNSGVTIEPSQSVVNIGDMIDLRCVYTGTDSPRYHWTRPNHVALPLNSLEHGNILRISNIELSESGIYRCHVISQDGGSHDGEYNLIVQGGNDAPAIETKFVPYGKGFEMRCRPNLEEPVDYQWSKLGGLLPEDTEAYDNVLKLTKVKAEDAGTYICKASNGQASTEVPTVVVVTGVVPNFHQAPKSWISLAPLADSYLKFTIEVSFKPENYDGIIFYNDETVDGTGDYIMLALAGGYPEFHFDLGSGAAVIRADKPVSLGEWHTIKLLRNRKEGTMLVDGEGPYKAINSGKKQGLDLKEPLYIGGVPDYNAINPQAHANTGFVGCISRLVLGDRSFDLIGEQTDSVGVTTCETCAENPCNNGGVCQEASTKNGYRCLCRAGYSGKHCDSIGQPCYPGACGDGQCVDKESDFECYCPHGKSGPRCELFTPNLNEPAFRDDRAYLAYPTPTVGRRLKLSMNFKPSDNGDGILMYCSQSEEGLGDFVALVIKDRYIEFRFDVGSGMAVIRSNHVVQPGTWTHVTLSRDLRDGRISINGGQIFEGRSPGSARTMTLNTPLYIGGIDRRKITVNKNIGVDRNFHGCINELEMSAKNFGFRKSIIDSANVEDCSTFPVSNVTRLEPTTQQPTRPPTTFYDPCERKPCIHGVCQIVADYDYSCTCDYGYVGRDCEKILKQCELMRPCQNGGSCMDQHGSYKCDCRLGFSGKDCEKKVDIIYDVAFRGDGWLELDRSIMPHEEENEVLCFEISTNKSNGLVMWHGQTPNDLSSDDYIALAVVDGYVEFQYDLGSGPAVMRVTAHRVDDGERHRIILKRKFSEGNIELDGEHMESGISYGLQQLLNVRGSVYLGGVPDWAMTYGRYNDGFSGCIYAMEVQDSAGIDIGSKAIRGKNVEPCTRARWIPSSLIFTDGDSDGFDDFVPPPPVNIIHPKPTANVATANIKSIYLLVAVQNTIGLSMDAKMHSILRAVLSIALVALANVSMWMKVQKGATLELEDGVK